MPYSGIKSSVGFNLLLLAVEEAGGEADWAKKRARGKVETVEDKAVDGADTVVHDGLPAAGHQVGDGVDGVHGGVAHLVAYLHGGAADVVRRLHGHRAGGGDGARRRVDRLVDHAHEGVAGGGGRWRGGAQAGELGGAGARAAAARLADLVNLDNRYYILFNFISYLQHYVI